MRQANMGRHPVRNVLCAGQPKACLLASNIHHRHQPLFKVNTMHVVDC
jgi:hypothetical protein